MPYRSPVAIHQVECLVFDKQEEVLIVGCAGGSMQCWNLEYRTQLLMQRRTVWGLRLNRCIFRSHAAKPFLRNPYDLSSFMYSSV